MLVVPVAYDRNKAIRRNNKVQKHILPSSGSDEEDGEWTVTHRNLYLPGSDWAHRNPWKKRR